MPEMIVPASLKERTEQMQFAPAVRAGDMVFCSGVIAALKEGEAPSDEAYFRAVDEAFAEIDLLGALSACPGGDCSAEHSSDAAACHPLLVEVFAPTEGALDGWESPALNGYDRSHGGAR